MARKAGQGKEEEESRARQQEEKTPVRDGEKTPAYHGRGHHVVEQGGGRPEHSINNISTTYGAESWGKSFHLKPENTL
ncbi:hypothetical protein STEG23_029412 [Scotinomys teguina]